MQLPLKLHTYWTLPALHSAQIKAGSSNSHMRFEPLPERLLYTQHLLSESNTQPKSLNFVAYMLSSIRTKHVPMRQWGW